MHWTRSIGSLKKFTTQSRVWVVGADIAAVTFGRALSYRWQDGIDTADEREPDGPIIQTSVGRATIMPLPGGFERIKMVWTGHSADTKTLVQSVRSFASAHP